MDESLRMISPQELVDEAKKLRETISDSATRLGELYRSLYTYARRRPTDESTSTYLVVANAGVRFAGMVLQGAQRAKSTDRVLSALADRQREAADADARLKAADERRKKQLAKAEEQRRHEAPTTVEALDDLYGEELA